MPPETDIEQTALQNPYDKPERFIQLTEAFNRHIELLDGRRKDMNQRATWTLATATGFVAILGLLKDTRINDTVSSMIRGQITNSVADGIIAVVVILFVVAYPALLYFVTKVYSPQSVGYPLNPIKTKYWAQDEIQHHENIWNGLLDSYVEPDGMEYSRIVLKEQIDSIKNQQKLEEELTENLYSSFRLLWFLAFCTTIILILG